jgi:ribonuclease Z
MELLFLGTSSGTPTRNRNVSGLAVLPGQGKGWYLVDCGEGTQHRLLRTPLSLHGLAGVFITHVHGDHCYGLPGLLASAGLQGRTQALDIVAPDGIQAWLQATFTLTHTHLPFELRFHATETLLEGAVWQGAYMAVGATALAHRVPSYGYRFMANAAAPRLNIEKLQQARVPRGSAWGALARGQDVWLEGQWLRSADFLHYQQSAQCIVVAGDNSEPSLLARACTGAQALVHEATYTAEVAEGKAQHGHSSAAAVAAFAAGVGLPNLVLTHFSPRYQANAQRGLSMEDLYNEAAARYAGQLILAADYDHFRLTREGVLVRAALER